jgi:uncharacterized membrane protein
MIGYKSRLDRDLQRWRDSGIIDAGTAQAIRADVAARGGRISLPGILAILGAVLLCFAAMTFVAANWQELSKLVRLAILFGALWASYAGAWALQRASTPFLAEAAILMASGLFGANIMLIAQIYHIGGNPPDAVLTWACGVLLGGIVLQSRSALALAVILFAVWSWWEVIEQSGEVHWPFLMAWAACALPIVWLSWKPGYHLLAISLAGWIVGLGYLLDDWDLLGTRGAHPLVIAIGLVVAGAGIAARAPIDRRLGFGGSVVIYGLAIAFAGLFALQFLEKTPVAGIAILAVLTLGLVIGALFYGVHADSGALMSVAYLLFCIELLALYFKTLGTLLDTALFFLIAGVIVIILATLAWRLNRRRLLQKGASS